MNVNTTRGPIANDTIYNGRIGAAFDFDSCQLVFENIALFEVTHALFEDKNANVAARRNFASTKDWT